MMNEGIRADISHSLAGLADVEIEAQRNNTVAKARILLTQIAKSHGVFFVVRLVASVIGEIRAKSFMKAHGVKLAVFGTYEGTPRTLNSAIPDSYELQEKEGEMGLEHICLWRKGQKNTFLTSEPYYIQKQQLKTLIAYCDECDVDFQIDAESFYFPGHTIRILFKKGEISQYDATAHKYQDRPKKQP